MRQAVPRWLLILLLAGCQAAPVPAAPDAPAGAPPAGPASAAAAPAPPPRLDDLRVAPALAVATARPARVYTGRGPWYLLVEELAAGAAVTFLGSREGWLQVQTASGGKGWLASADARLTDAGGRGVEFALRPGRWELHTLAGVRVELVRAAPGVMHLAASGLSADLTVLEGDRALGLRGALPGTPRAALPVGEGGIAAISMSEQGLLVDLEGYAPPGALAYGAPVHRVTAAAPGRVEVEFRPALDAVARAGNGWRLHLRGAVAPVLRQEGGELVLDLPGAVAAPGFGEAPPGAAGGLRLRVPVPAGPYALYRPEPGVLELRFLPPGLAGKTVVVDPGHGGEETGAAGPAGNLEKDVNLAVALQLGDMLARAGARVVLTRSGDERGLLPADLAPLATVSERTRADLEARTTLANAAGADLYLSVHGNGGPAGDAGTETYWTVPNLNAARSRRLAELVQAEVVSALGLYDRGVKQRPFHVIRYAHAPAALAELGFMSDYAEERLLSSPAGQAAAAGALFRAIESFFNAP